MGGVLDLGFFLSGLTGFCILKDKENLQSVTIYRIAILKMSSNKVFILRGYYL